MTDTPEHDQQCEIANTQVLLALIKRESDNGMNLVTRSFGAWSFGWQGRKAMDELTRNLKKVDRCECAGRKADVERQAKAIEDIGDDDVRDVRDMFTPKASEGDEEE